MSERLQPPNIAAINEALSRFRMIWSDARPDQTIDNPFGTIGLSMTMVSPRSMEEAEESQEMPAALGALNELLGMTPLSTHCRGYLMEQAATMYKFGQRVDTSLKLLGIVFSEDDLGTFDPTKANENEKRYLEEAIYQARSVMIPDLNRQKVAKIIPWVKVFTQRFNDHSFADFVDAP